MGEKEEMKEMFQELTGFEKKNISLRINGVPARSEEHTSERQSRI